MKNTATNRSEKTKANYARKAQALCRQTAEKFDYTSPNLVPITQVVEHLIHNKASQSNATWRQYKAALSYHIENELALIPESESTLREELLLAHRLLAKQTAEGTQKKGSRTSANKQKGIKQDDLDTLLSYLEDQLGKHMYARALSTWISASRITGVRPSEWESAGIKLIDGNTVLVIKNAKHDELRANGEYRHLILNDLSADEMSAIQSMLSMLDGYLESTSFSTLYEALRDYMYHATRCALSPRKKYPSLYSLRHQFIADAKASGFTKQEVAALIGHASDFTASKHYARKVVGRKGSVRVQPTPSEVETVRLVSNNFSFANYKANNTNPKKQKTISSK